MSLNLLEGAVDALSAYLQANYAAKVAALNLRYGGTLVEEPKKYYLGNMPTSTPESPSVVIHGGAWSPKAQRLVNLHVANDISLVVFIGDNDVEDRFRKLCRHMLGIIEMLRTGEASMAYNVKLVGPMALTEPMNTQPFLQGIILPILLEQMETY
jgi:hypothetical protein